jgi:hypothetical protein
MKNCQKINKLIVFTIVSVLSISILFTSAFATPVEQSIKVLFNNIKIVMSGKQVTPTDINGKAVEPFTYNGTTYLPLRAIATTLGSDVTWDNATNTVTLKEKADKKTKLDLTTWFKENPNTWRTVNNGSWSNNPKDAPTDEELAEIFEIACKTQTAVNWNEYFFIAVRDPKEQNAIVGDRWGEGCTSDGTVTVLILADQVTDQAQHKDKYKDYYMKTPFSLFDAGMACGNLNLAAYSLGYGTHYFGTMNGSTVGPNEGKVGYDISNYDISRFLNGKNYTRGWGFPAVETNFDVQGNCVLIGSVVIGKPDSTIDATTSATQHGRPSNWAIWEPDANTPPLK